MCHDAGFNKTQNGAPSGERLQKYIARCGIASRRTAENIILSGRVSINGEVVSAMGRKVAKGDKVLLDGNLITPEKKYHYIALNKPVDYICSAKDSNGRALASSLLPEEIKERLYNVGRLDYKSSGLIFFTNDGNFAAHLTHPSFQIDKEYLVKTNTVIPDTLIDAFRSGISIEGDFFKCKSIERAGKKGVHIVLDEGKNREIRRVFSFFHLHIVLLHRIRIGCVTLCGMKLGECRPICPSDVRWFMEDAAL